MDQRVHIARKLCTLWSAPRLPELGQGMEIRGFPSSHRTAVLRAFPPGNKASWVPVSRIMHWPYRRCQIHYSRLHCLHSHHCGCHQTHLKRTNLCVQSIREGMLLGTGTQGMGCLCNVMELDAESWDSKSGHSAFGSGQEPRPRKRAQPHARADKCKGTHKRWQPKWWQC